MDLYLYWITMPLIRWVILPAKFMILKIFVCRLVLKSTFAMKRYGSINSLLLICSMLALLSCEGLYIPDPIDPRLPKYTENGNDVAGAIINNIYWTSVERIGFQTTSYKPYIITSAITDSLVIQFSGKMSYEY